MQASPPPHIFYSVGEPSGDLHGANLIRCLRAIDPKVRCVGFGGPKMRDAGCELLYDLTQLAVMWIVRVVLNIHRFLGLLRQADHYFKKHRPDAVVLIDYPGFNWWVARRAKAHGIPVFYYGTPQLWAWAGWRVHKMRRLTDHVLCKLPFEPAWFQERDCQATFVGHPYFDELAQQQLKPERIRPLKTSHRLVTILPGSRDQEIAANLPMFLNAAARISEYCPDVCFAVASFSEQQAEVARIMISNHPALANKVQVAVGCTAELIHEAECCLACSGSVSLELLYHAKPSVIGYRVGRWAYWAQNKLRTVKFITLGNLIAGQDIYCRAGTSINFEAEARQAMMPEFVCCEDQSQQIANRLISWLNNPTAYSAVVGQLGATRERYAQLGASERAASYIYHQLVPTTTDARDSRAA